MRGESFAELKSLFNSEMFCGVRLVSAGWPGGVLLPPNKPLDTSGGARNESTTIEADVQSRIEFVKLGRRWHFLGCEL